MPDPLEFCRSHGGGGDRHRARLLATLAPPFEPSGPDDFLGKNFASVYFALSMLGAFDGCHFFVPTLADCQPSRQALARLGLTDGIEVHCSLELPDLLAAGRYAAFHVPDAFPHLANICHIRQRLGADFPITAIIHSISYASLEREILDLLSAPTRESDIVFCSSTAGAEALINLFAHVRQRKGMAAPIDLTLCVVPYGVDTSRFAPRDRSQARARVDLPGDRHYFLSLARLSIHDKFDCGPLLEAFRRAIAELDEPWDLVLAGGARDPSYLDFVAEQIQDRGLAGRVHLRANFDDALKPSYYAACDVFVSPSDNIQETFGLAVIEAMASGLPIVASDWDGYKDTVTETVGSRVPTYMPQLSRTLVDRQVLDNSLVHLLVGQAVAIDLGTLATRMAELGRDAALRDRKGRAARQRALELFSYEAVSDAIRATLVRSGAGDGSRDTAAAPASDSDPPAPEGDDVPLEALLDSVPGGTWSPFALFRGHPTRELAADDRLVATEFGQEAIRREMKVYLCEEMHALLYLERLRPIVRACADPRPLGSLQDELLADGDDPERLLYSLYWLVKQGMLDVLPPA